MIVKGGFVHVAFALIKRITIGDLYIPILNEKLHSVVTLKNALQTENGYLFVYISDKPISFDLSAIETEFNINLQDYYQIRPISNTEFQILQREK